MNSPKKLGHILLRISRALLISVAMVTFLSGCTLSNNKADIETVAIQRSAIITKDVSAIEPQSSETIALYKETEHFVLYCSDKDKLLLEDLAKVLESAFNKVSKDLDFTLKEKIIVKIYPNTETFHKAIGKPEAPWWYVGEGSGGEFP